MLEDDTDKPSWRVDYDARMAEHEAALKPGQRVRIMPGESCPHHGEQEAGLTGVIVDINGAAPHRFCVLFDRPLWITSSAIYLWSYAATELTPVTHEEILAEILKQAGFAP